MNKKITTTVIDDWLESYLADYLSSYLFKGILYRPGHGSIENDTSFLFGEEKIEYKFNRLIYFDAKKLHKGHAPKQNVPRVTLAFKTEILI
jgi:hypothetical protein